MSMDTEYCNTCGLLHDPEDGDCFGCEMNKGIDRLRAKLGIAEKELEAWKLTAESNKGMAALAGTLSDKNRSLEKTLALERTWLKSHHKNLELAHERESVLKKKLEEAVDTSLSCMEAGIEETGRLKRKLDRAVKALEHYKQRSGSRVARMTLEDLDRRIL